MLEKENEEELQAQRDERGFVDVVVDLMQKSPEDWYIDYTQSTSVLLLKNTWGTEITVNREKCEAHIIKPHYLELSSEGASRLYDYVERWEEVRLDIASNRNVFNEPENTMFERRVMALIAFTAVVYSTIVFLLLSINS